MITVVIGDTALIGLLAALLAAAARRLGQPAVIGQLLDGIMLGPASRDTSPVTSPGGCSRRRRLALPMSLGLALTLGVLSGQSVAFVLFLAVAVSITAVLVLAAIVRDDHMTMTVPGVLSTAAATVVDLSPVRK